MFEARWVMPTRVELSIQLILPAGLQVSPDELIAEPRLFQTCGQQKVLGARLVELVAGVMARARM